MAIVSWPLYWQQSPCLRMLGADIRSMMHHNQLESHNSVGLPFEQYINCFTLVNMSYVNLLLDQLINTRGKKRIPSPPQLLILDFFRLHTSGREPNQTAASISTELDRLP